MPRVSVLMPVYNARDFVRQAVGSVLAQTFDDFELVIINDGSSDGTADILTELSETDRRVVLVTQPNSGYTRALNEGARVARGELLARLDADDVAYPTRLESQVAFLDQHPKVGLIGAWAELIDSAGGSLTGRKPTEGCRTDIEVKWQLLFSNPFVHSSVVMRRGAYDEARGYDPSEEPAEDYALWSRISEKHPVGILPAVQIQYRVHGNSVSVARHMEQRRRARCVAATNLAQLGVQLPAKDLEAIDRVYSQENVQPRDIIVTASRLPEIHEAFMRRHLHSGADTEMIRAQIAQETMRAVRKLAVGNAKSPIRMLQEFCQLRPWQWIRGANRFLIGHACRSMARRMRFAAAGPVAARR